ncbi:hydrogenase maturation protease [Streptomyces sp. IBSBF 2953]|uniref:hydrogenase maturation protease n=1 Tax=Streptomyces TaxID=1883 RepID=UPI002119F846|nr:hydrogenase maturation protease [Streptomyces scabiei]MCQ9181830.1 hydrogenase maturation protease [Streptomyces hayashii]MDX3115258.1 hydrogenase maturation protease [Streptomyces scabiei]
MNPSPSAGPRTLVAGIGNVFLSDDGFGVETARRLAERDLPAHVEVVDIGVRGVHLAYQLLDGYDTLVLVDATARGEAPGTLYVIEHDAGGAGGSPSPPAPALDGHRMTPDTVLALLGALCAGTGGEPPRRVLVVGCEPASVEEGIGLSAPVSDAVPEAVRLIEELLCPGRPGESAPRATAGGISTRGETG